MAGCTERVEAMQDRLFIADYLSQYLEEIEPIEFYRRIFPEGELEKRGQQEIGKYNAIAVELISTTSGRKMRAKKHIITDDLERLQVVLRSPNFTIISPISYAGKNRTSDNARFIYALAIDLDGIAKQSNLVDLLHQIDKVEHLPKPTYLVWSGSGLHLYYQFEKPIPCFRNIVVQLAELKNELTKKIWNGYVTELSEKPQIESLFQGFRLVGGVTKGGHRSKAFIYGDKVTLEYLNGFVSDKSKVTDIRYKSKLTLEEAKRKYPEWYQRRLIEKQPRGTWTANKAVYDWWLRKLKEEIAVGHRYYGVMILAVYAKKCGVDREILEEDAFSLVEYLDSLTTEENNHFTEEDIYSALEMFNDNYITFPIKTIERLSAIPIKRNKRNHRKQAVHLRIARSNKAILKEVGEMKPEGRPSKKGLVIEWKKAHQDGTIIECIEDLGISKSTAYKYWKAEEEANN